MAEQVGELLTFDFNSPEDGTMAANDAYGKILFLPNWAGNNSGTNATNNNWNDAVNGTYYVDDITAMSIPRPATCTDGIMNGDETGIDCGGSSCAVCPPDAPNPSTPNSEVFAILQGIQDTGGFTNFWGLNDFFGTNQGEIDLDATASTDEALKMDFSVTGWGGGISTGTLTDLTAYGWLHFDYYAPNLPPGTNGHQAKFTLIDDNNENDYVLSLAGGDGTLVFDSWQSVDIPLSVFTGKGFDITKLKQFKLGTDSNLNTTIVYFDNMYFSVNKATTLGVEDIVKTAFKIYPNPTNNKWNIKTSGQNIKSVQVVDMLGKTIMNLSPNKKTIEVDATSLPAGLYFAKVSSENGTKSIKLVKQ